MLDEANIILQRMEHDPSMQDPIDIYFIQYCHFGFFQRVGDKRKSEAAVMATVLWERMRPSGFWTRWK
jgi:hypothetical protein